MEPPRPIRVLHVVPSYWPATAYGGPIESVHALCLAEARAGARVHVLTTDANGRERLELPNGRVARTNDGLRIRYARRWGGVSFAPALLTRLPRAIARSDVVHLTAVYSFPTIPTLFFSRLVRKPVVWSPRGALLSWTGETRPALKAWWRRVCAATMPRRTVLHVTSDAEEAASRSAFPGAEIVVIPNGVDIPESVARPKRGGTTQLVFLGRLHPIKALENLIEACRICTERGWTAWRLSIAGKGDAAYEASLRDLVSRAGIGSAVAFLGPVQGERKTALLCSADLVVVPSHSENFSMVVVEALAHGVPVVASTGTPWSALQRRECGWWVENAPEGLAKALLASRGADLVAMGARGRRWMQEEYPWDAVAERMLATYRRLAQSTKR